MLAYECMLNKPVARFKLSFMHVGPAIMLYAWGDFIVPFLGAQEESVLSFI